MTERIGTADPSAVDWTAGGPYDLMAPRRVDIEEIATSTTDKTAWTQISIPRPCILKPRDGPHLVRFIPVPPDDNTLSDGRYYTALDGVCLFLVPGIHNWYVNVPTPGTPADVVFTLLDAMSAVVAPYLAGQAGNTPGITPEAPTQVTVASAASTAILAASSARGRYVICNTDTANRVYITFGGQTAAVENGVLLGPGGSFICEPDDGFSTLAVAGRAETADVIVSIQTWR